MPDLLPALALLLAVEGLILAVFPGAMRVLFARMALEPDAALRRGGLISAVLGVGALWLLR